MIRTVRLVTRPVRYLADLVLPHQCVLCSCFADSNGPYAACWMDPPQLAMIRAYLHYNDVSRKLILAFKHGNGLQLTPFLTSLMARDFAMMTDGEDSLVVPAPLYRQRYFRRRYNQSAELAQRLCCITARGLPDGRWFWSMM